MIFINFVLDSNGDLLDKLVDTIGVIRSLKSEDRQTNGQKKKNKKDKQRSTKHAHKTKDRVT